MTQNEHAYAICCRTEVAGDVISGENITNVDGCALLNFEAAIISSFRENQIVLYCIKQLVARHLSVSEITNRRRERVK